MNKFLTLILGFSILLGGCGLKRGTSESSKAQTITETRQHSGFIAIKASGSFRLIVTAGEDYAVSLEGEKSTLPGVKTDVDEGMLIIKSEAPAIDRQNKVTIKVSVPELSRVEVFGATDAVVNNLKGPKSELSANGTSTIEADGSTTELTAQAGGASMVDAEKLTAQSVKASATGASEVTVNVAADLIAEAFGASTIKYIGEPKIVKNTAGTSEVKKK